VFVAHLPVHGSRFSPASMRSLSGYVETGGSGNTSTLAALMNCRLDNGLLMGNPLQGRYLTSVSARDSVIVADPPRRQLQLAAGFFVCDDSVMFWGDDGILSGSG
jgi:hypothetical protein